MVIFLGVALFTPAVLVAQDQEGSQERSRKVAPRLTARGTTPSPGLPQPIEPAPAEPLAVRIVGLPIDETGHIVINDHAHGPRPVEVTNPQRPHEFAGFTVVETLPNIGVFGMTRLCASEIPGSRMCTLDEALNTSDPPMTPTYVPAGWVRDDALTRQPGAAKTPFEPVPDPGAEPLPAPQNTQCMGWSSTDGWATTLSSDGGVGGRFCYERAPVACCRPKI